MYRVLFENRPSDQVQRTYVRVIQMDLIGKEKVISWYVALLNCKIFKSVLFCVQIERINYVEVPFLFNFMHFKGSEIKLLQNTSFTFGLTFGYLVRGFSDGSYGFNSQEDMSLTNFDLSGYGSINYHFGDKLVGKFVFNYNAIPITQFGNEAWWNRVIRFTLMYKFLK